MFKLKGNKYKTLITLFITLYVMVAGISFIHAIDFFSVGNVYWMSVVLALAFEVAQAGVLFAILTTKHRKSVLAWCMLVILVAVQCSANVYSVYKYMNLSDEVFYQYIKDSLLFFMYSVDEKEVMVTVSWVIGALLPLIALGLTAMVADSMNFVEEGKMVEIDSPKIENEPKKPSPINEGVSKGNIREVTSSFLMIRRPPRSTPINRAKKTKLKPVNKLKTPDGYLGDVKGKGIPQAEVDKLRKNYKPVIDNIPNKK